MKLELKFIAPYLAHGLKCQYFGIVDVLEYHKLNEYIFAKLPDERNGGFGLKIGQLKEIKIYKKYWKAYIGTYHSYLKSFMNGYDFKPLLLPLSALTEPLEDGSIPIVELHKIAHKSDIGDIIKYWYVDYSGSGGFVSLEYYDSSKSIYSFSYDEKLCRFITRDETSARPKATAYQLKLFEYLHSIHADIYGLIDAGLAIDKRTIKL